MKTFLLRALAGLFVFAGLVTLHAQGDDHGAAVKRSLERARALYPESTNPESLLSQTILARIDWLTRNNTAFFANPDWPLKLTAAEALALGIRPTAQRPPPTVQKRSGRYMGVVTKNFSTTGASFRKGQQVVIESLQDYNKRGTVIVDGMPILLWLDHIKIIKELPHGEDAPALVKIDTARYGFPGKNAYNVAPMVQTLVSPESGRYEILVSDALLSPSAAQQINRGIALPPPFDPNTGRPNSRPSKVLTISYTINGIPKTKQALEGQTLTLD